MDKINRPDIEDLMSFSVSFIQKELGRVGYTLSSLDSALSRGGVAKGQVEWNTGEKKIGSMGYSISRDNVGLYVELRYTYSGGDCDKDCKQRYYFQKRESNLVKGSYRYLFLDPYGKRDSVCSKLYFVCIGRMVGFFPRSVLSSYGICYRQQRESHKGRYVWSMYHRANGEKYGRVKNRKRHYRGKETPFWKRYSYIQDESERRVLGELLKVGMINQSDLIWGQGVQMSTK